MYPMLCEGVEFRVSGKKGRQKRFYVQNAEGDEFEVPCEVFKALRHADGTRPLCLPDRGYSLLPDLKRCGLVRTNRLV